MKLEVRENMYIRTEKGIAKIKRIFSDGSEPYYEAKYETDTYLEIYYDSQYVSEYDVLKASFNIIDLIEVKDIIEIDVIDEDNYSHILGINFIRIENERDLSNIKDMVLNGSAKLIQIVTHEQMEQMSYKVNNER